MNKIDTNEEVNTLNKEADNILTNWQKQTDNMAEKLTEAIYKMLKKMGGVAEVDTMMGEDCPLISYDGGNNPEYGSTINGCVYRVKALKVNKKPSFVVDMEEEERYPVSRMNKAEIPVIYNFVKWKFEDFMEEKAS